MALLDTKPTYTKESDSCLKDSTYCFYNYLMTNCWKIAVFIIISIIPLYIIFSYETYQQQIYASDHLQEHIRQANHQLDELTKRNINNYESLKEQLQGQIPDLLLFIEQIEAVFEQQGQAQFFVWGTQDLNIINVQVTQVHAYELNIIKQELMRQLNWYNKQFGMNLQISEWNQGMELENKTSQVIVLFSELKYEHMEENIALKLKRGEYRSQYYLEEIANELNQLPAFSHCKFTSKSCRQSSIVFISHDQPKSHSFWQVEDMHFLDQSDQQLIFNTIGSILKMEGYLELAEKVGMSLAKDFYGIVKAKRYLEWHKRTINYIQYTMQKSNFSSDILMSKIKKNPEEAFRYLKNGQFLTPYIHTKQQIYILTNFFNQLQNIQLQKQIIAGGLLEDNRVGVIDNFPNDFEIGVYLPIFVVFLYPWVLKIKEAIVFLFAIIKKRP